MIARACVAALLLAIAAWASATAAAATPIVIAGGKVGAPKVVMDAQGTAHIAWSWWEDRSYVMWYCRLPRGASKCENAKGLGPGGEDTRVLVRGARVLVLNTFCCSKGTRPGHSNAKLYAAESKNGGRSFGHPFQIGSNGISGDAELVPGTAEVITVNDQSFGARVQISPTTGHRRHECYDFGSDLAPCKDLEAWTGNGVWFSGSVAFLSPSTALFATTTRGPRRIPPPPLEEGNIFVSRLTLGAVRNPPSLGPLINVGKGDEPQLAGRHDAAPARRSIQLLHRVRRSESTWQLVVRRWIEASQSFGRPANVSEVGFPLYGTLALDPLGRMHVAWREKEPTLRYCATRPDGSWKPAVTLVTRAQSPGGIADLDLAAGADGSGVVVWRAGPKGPIRALRFGPTKPSTRGGCVPERPAAKALWQPATFSGSALTRLVDSVPE